MTGSVSTPVLEKAQLTTLGVMMLLMAVMSLILYRMDHRFFRYFIANINSLVLMIAIILLAGLLLAFFLWRGWFALSGNEIWRGIGLAALAASIFGVVIILVDKAAVYPADTNITWPNAWLYYPVLGFAAEVIFHLLPLAVILTLLTSPLFQLDFDRVLWVSLVVVSLLEPIFQTVLGSSTPIPIWAKVYVAVHIWLINVTGLFLFRRYGFGAMYGLRLMYYLIWHVLWGHLRLGILF